MNKNLIFFILHIFLSNRTSHFLFSSLIIHDYTAFHLHVLHSVVSTLTFHSSKNPSKIKIKCSDSTAVSNCMSYICMGIVFWKFIQSVYLISNRKRFVLVKIPWGLWSTILHWTKLADLGQQWCLILNYWNIPARNEMSDLRWFIYF